MLNPDDEALADALAQERTEQEIEDYIDELLQIRALPEHQQKTPENST